MEAFAVTCTTCKSRLKVRSAAAIGQVVPCPKCGGMVMIKPPEPVSPESGNAATKPVEEEQKAPVNPELTKEFEDIDLLLAGASRLPAYVPAAREKLAAPQPVSPAADPAPSAAAPAEKEPSHPLPDETPQSQLPAADWATHRAGRYGAWLATSILAGITLAVAVVVISSRFVNREWELATLPAGAADKVPPTPVVSEPHVAEEAKAKPKSDPIDAQTPAPPPDETPAPPEAEIKPPEKAPESDPLGIGDKPPTAPDGTKPPLAIGDDPLGKFPGVVNDGADEPPVPTAPPIKTDAGPMADPAEGAPEKPTAPRPPPRTIDLAARLKDPLPGLDAQGVPLVDFLRTISDLSTIPITLDPDGLAFAKLSPTSPVNVKLENTTVGKALTEALRPMLLEYVTAEDHVVVRLADTAEGNLPALTFPMGDLTKGDEQQIQLLAEWITALTATPEGWKEGDDEKGVSLTPGNETFHIRQRRSVLADVFFLCEKLRVARGLKPKSNFETAAFRVDSRTARARAALATPITLNYSYATPLTTILDRLEAAAKVRILVDWQAAAAEGWNPDAEATLTVDKLPLAEALTALTTPLDLAWRVIDEQTLEITTPDALAQTRELELHPAKELASDATAGEALVARLRAALEGGMASDPPLALRFDPVSRCVLASLSQPQQREAERLLSQWKTEAAAAAK